MSANNQEPIGPITQALLQNIWKQLFNSNSPIYLPGIIKNGEPHLGLPSYDPAKFSGKSRAFPIQNVPSCVISQACTDDQSPTPPVGTDPTMQLGDVQLLNLSEMVPGPISFAPNAPQVTIEVIVGNKTNPFVLEAQNTTAPNFFFAVQCCLPAAEDKKKCNNTWCTTATGQFKAQVSEFKLSITSQLNTPATPNGSFSISILHITLTAASKNIDLEFDLKNSPAWVKSMAQIAVQQGINDNAVQEIIQSFLNQGSVRQNIETLINAQLSRLPLEEQT